MAEVHRAIYEQTFYLTIIPVFLSLKIATSIDPKEQLAAVKDMRANGLVPLGNWHSHPESPSRPSEEDKRLAYDSTASYMILSLMDNENPVLNSFHIEGTESEKEELVLL